MIEHTVDGGAIERLEDDLTFFADTPENVGEAVVVAEHLLGDSAMVRLLGTHYADALRCVTRQARQIVEDHARGVSVP